MRCFYRASASTFAGGALFVLGCLTTTVGWGTAPQLAAVSPALLRAYLRLRPGFARRLARYRDHAAVGAQHLRQLGAAELADIVSEHHARRPAHPLTVRLQLADERN